MIDKLDFDAMKKELAFLAAGVVIISGVLIRFILAFYDVTFSAGEPRNVLWQISLSYRVALEGLIYLIRLVCVPVAIKVNFQTSKIWFKNLQENIVKVEGLTF